MLVKRYGNDRESEARYSPADCIGCRAIPISGRPKAQHNELASNGRERVIAPRRAIAICGAFSTRRPMPQLRPKGASSKLCIAAQSPPATQSSHRGNRPSTVSANLVDLAPGSPLRRTRPSRQQTIEAKAHHQNDQTTPKTRLPDRPPEFSIPPTTREVIFDPEAWKINCRVQSFGFVVFSCRGIQPAVRSARDYD